MNANQWYVCICTVVSGIWIATLLCLIYWPTGDRERCLDWLIAFFFGGLFGMLVGTRLPRSWLALGLAVGGIIGYLVPTADVEHFNLFRESRNCLIFTVIGAILGAFWAIGVDVTCSQASKRQLRQSSGLFGSLLHAVGVAALCAPVIAFLIIRIFSPR